MGALTELDKQFGGLLLGATTVLVRPCLCMQLRLSSFTLCLQSSDYDHGQGLNANRAMLALIPVLRALALRFDKASVVMGLDDLGVALPAIDAGTLVRAVSLISADGSSRLERALAIAACVHQTASPVRF